jgi:hypothetical protein
VLFYYPRKRFFLSRKRVGLLKRRRGHGNVSRSDRDDFFLAYPVWGDVLLSADSEGFLRRKSKKRPCRRDGSGRALHSKTTPARRLFLKKQRG